MYTIFTDGSCNFNKKGAKNVGSYAFVIINESGVKTYEEVVKVENTTNNRMELSAVINSLLKLQKIDEPIVVNTDSEYVSNAVNLNWIEKWKKNDFTKGKKKTDIPNKDLWIQLYSLLKPNITIKWVKGHQNNIWNNYCDELCNSVYKKSYTVK